MDYLTDLNPHNPTGLERMHVMVLRELCDDPEWPLFVMT